MKTPAGFTPQDLEELKARGISTEEVERQLSLLEDPPAAPVLDRACTAGEGILRVSLDEGSGYMRAYNAAREDGRLSKFVPASGAASRLFKSVVSCRKRGPGVRRDVLEKAAAEGDADAAEVLKLDKALDLLPFYDQLKETAAKMPKAAGKDPVEVWMDALASPEGLNFAALPKGLIPFHRVPGGARTAVEEHLIESVDTLRDGRALCRLHFTVSPEHETLFRDRLAALVPPLEKARRVSFDVALSLQKPSTDTISLDANGRPARRADGKLLFRPGGHGALLDNLNELGGDVVFVKNVDNVPHDSHPGETSHWDALLAGILLDLQYHLFQRITWLTLRPRDPRLLAEAEEFAARRLNIRAPENPGEDFAARRQWLLSRLERPIRVCAVIPNAGEPGGGPFWVKEADGSLTPQIVESAQVSRDPAQREIFKKASHFNPVHMVLGLKDRRGEPFDLRQFSDPAAAFISDKSADGKPVKALERPGLWNGAMARWTTVFVEAPTSIFHPVKTLADLLRKDHQPE